DGTNTRRLATRSLIPLCAIGSCLAKRNPGILDLSKPGAADVSSVSRVCYAGKEGLTRSRMRTHHQFRIHVVQLIRRISSLLSAIHAPRFLHFAKRVYFAILRRPFPWATIAHPAR